MALGSSPARLAGKKAAIAIVVLGLFNVFLLFQITAGRNTLTTMQAQLDKLENSAHTRQSQYEHMVEIVATKVDTQQKEFTEFKDWIHKTFEDWNSKIEKRKGLFNTQPAEAVQSSVESEICRGCKSGSLIDGGVDVSTGCTQYCSTGGFCGTTSAYAEGGTDCRVVSKTSSTDMLRPLGGPNGLADRMSRLEAITKGRLNWIREPYVGARVMHRCAKEEHIDEHYICHDHFPPPSDRAEPCIIYDMGIREQPGFGKTLAEKYPQCQVHAFDPSPIAVAFQSSDDETAKALRALPNYHFHPYGSGGVDGHVKLYDYNWGQVSSIRVPHFVTNDCGYGEEQNLADPNIQKDLTLKYHQRRCRTNDNMNESEEKMQKKVQGESDGTRGGFGETSFLLEVKTLKTIMKELGHTHIDVLKLDVEGSEFAFLESALDDFDCPPVEQMSIEWHHYNFDSRYGGGASPEVNAIATYLHDRCNVKQYQITMDNGGWEDNFEWLKDAYLQLRFNTGSYMRAR